ncbi:EAL domain-containing response regulator [Pseudomonas chlororaphis]|uniref:EAL domain-containing response regulator n=1 Tax=Pseudomonas chlororaphis TaxID=587753 RepID=UPI0013DD9DEF|nr:EAL domain-containing response regulator [Pseudomonas chlororaphis]
MALVLQQLGMSGVLQAEHCAQAKAQIEQVGCIDILLCDLGIQGADSLQFLRWSSQAGMVKAVVQCGELEPELRRGLGHILALMGVRLLGELEKPLEPQLLQRVLKRYSHRRQLPRLLVSNLQDLPSEDDVRRGLALGEFRAWFQPKFDMQSGALAGIEALARWEHPSRGLLLPEIFLAAVLAYDLIDEMFKQLLEQGLGMLGMLRRDGVSLELAFNLHASQLAHCELIDEIQHALRRHDLPGSTLLFELAENGLLDMQFTTLESLLRLRMMGCGLAIDDFGVGFSALKLLCQVPFNQIKLEGECVQNLWDPRSRAVVNSTLALADSLNMSVVVEGVSSQRIRNELVHMGCKYGQGFYLARPMTGRGLRQWLDGVVNR